MTKRGAYSIARAVFSATLLFVAACGQNSSSGLPRVPDPNAGKNRPINTVPLEDKRIPDWVNQSVPIMLPSCTGTSSTCSGNQSLTGLIDIAGNVFTPLVETFFNLELTDGWTSTPSGTVNIGFEHFPGFTYTSIPSFAGASSLTAGALDMIFSNSALTVRFVANVVNDELQASNIYYRIRQSGETQCQAVTYQCYVNYGWGPVLSNNCPGTPPPDTTVTTCKNYMYLGNAAVKRLGSVNGKYSQWAQ